MTSTIKPKSNNLEYEYLGESYQTEIKLVESKTHEEPSGEYKTPNDSVIICKYRANSVHGAIDLEVIARRSGVNTFFDIEHIDITSQPQHIENLIIPDFGV